MKIHHPILLLSLSIATALALLAEAAPSSHRSHHLQSAHPPLSSTPRLHSNVYKPKNPRPSKSGSLTKRASPNTPAKPKAKGKGKAVRHKKSVVPPRLPKTPLLLLPDSRSVWHTGSYQTVQWSLKYIRSLPKDTTVDIVLVDAKTNHKIHSFKRFIPFKKGSAQVWVPVKMSEGVSYVLVLELYRGRSQEQLTNTLAASPPLSSAPDNTQNHKEPSASSSNSYSTIVRRSDISISSGPRRVAREVESYDGGAPWAGAAGAGSGSTGSHHDAHDDDYYGGPSTEHGYEFKPNDLREEYPNTVKPLILEHTFGLHQKVYALTPYTLRWKTPDRVAELLEYTRQVQQAFSLLSKNPQSTARISSAMPKSTYLAKVMVELVTDQTMETVAVLARDIPAQAMFQYLSIQDRVPVAFYRLRVRMVIVEVNIEDPKTMTQEQFGVPATSTLVTGKRAKGLGLEGWEFPSGGEVIDRYETITRRFWMSQGAL